MLGRFAYTITCASPRRSFDNNYCLQVYLVFWYYSRGARPVERMLLALAFSELLARSNVVAFVLPARASLLAASSGEGESGAAYKRWCGVRAPRLARGV